MKLICWVLLTLCFLGTTEALPGFEHGRGQNCFTIGKRKLAEGSPLQKVVDDMELRIMLLPLLLQMRICKRGCAHRPCLLHVVARVYHRRKIHPKKIPPKKAHLNKLSEQFPLGS